MTSSFETQTLLRSATRGRRHGHLACRAADGTVLGSRRLMIKLVFVIRRREELPPEEFHRYWLEEHGPLARGLLESLGARRYVQTHTLDSELNAALAATRGTIEAYD